MSEKGQQEQAADSSSAQPIGGSKTSLSQLSALPRFARKVPVTSPRSPRSFPKKNLRTVLIPQYLILRTGYGHCRH
ncbi:hypothetical protein EMCG_06934 [[Emmonsia] crescens]|uniref:Uncharacterized protein n=1 Tax=[Emmonsia] crescens TaxID=73230 RepID=A0A0G2JBF8_9EURO|nr:hypothetical protein EMCG_06934 [Emmonsia crescens UAMH 3008]